MKRNCPFSPKQLGLFYLAIVFLLVGVWMISILTPIEIWALTMALYVYTRHALDYERITIAGTQSLFKRSWGSKIEHHEFNTIWTKLAGSESTGRDWIFYRRQCTGAFCKRAREVLGI
jgi:uncharacterized membrane protein